MCVCGDLIDELPLAQATVSEHLKVLKKAGIVVGEVSGPGNMLLPGPRRSGRAAGGRHGAGFKPCRLTLRCNQDCNQTEPILPKEVVMLNSADSMGNIGEYGGCCDDECECDCCVRSC